MNSRYQSLRSTINALRRRIQGSAPYVPPERLDPIHIAELSDEQRASLDDPAPRRDKPVRIMAVRRVIVPGPEHEPGARAAPIVAKPSKETH